MKPICNDCEHRYFGYCEKFERAEKMMDASILLDRVFKIKICVPASWTDRDILAWIAEESPRTHGFGWSFDDGQQRIQCSKDHENVHIILNA